MATHKIAHSRNGQNGTKKTPIDEAPLNRITIMATIAVFGGIFLDGHILGVIGHAVAPAAAELALSPIVTGLIAASALIGIFIGGSIFGRFADRFGRKKVFFWSLMGFAIVSVLQLFIVGAWDLVLYRVILGVLIGVEYAVGTAFLAEFLPKRKRSTMLGSISLFWFLGFVAALVAGHYWNPDAWRWLLASSVIPAVITLMVRVALPESPRWLASQGRTQEAMEIIEEHWGPEYGLPHTKVHKTESLAIFFRENDWRRILYSGLFWACQVAPLFTIFTFVPIVVSQLDLGGGTTIDLVVNGLQLLGAALGVWLLWAMSRRSLVISTFIATAAFLLILGLWTSMPALLAFILFGLFTVIFTASTNIQYVYPPEMFDTRFRSTGVGMAAAMSRIGASIATFFFPIALENLGVHTTLVIASLFPIIGLVASLLWAPETKNVELDAI